MFHFIKGVIVTMSIIASALTVNAQIFPPFPPVTVKLSDQSLLPIEISEAEITANINGVIAQTEMTLKFFNPNQRLLEGELSFPLPPEAFVSGYALDVNGQMVDGVIVEKAKARVVFEELSRQRIDPGLAEQSAGNTFKTRLYPLPAQGTRTIKIRYISPVVITDEAAGQAAYYVQPLRFPNQLNHFRLTLNVASAQKPPVVQGGSLANLEFKNWQTIYTASTELKDIALTEDLYVALMTRPEESLAVQKARKGDFFLYHKILNINNLNNNMLKPSATPVVLWDASLSREKSEHDREIEFLKTALKDATKITLVVFRNVPEAPVEFASVDDLAKALADIVYDGGTNLAAALSTVPKGSDAYLFCDGLDTLSAADALKATPDFRLSAFYSDKDQNAPFLRGLSTKTGGICADLRTVSIADAMKLLAAPAIVLSKVELDGQELADTAWRLDGKRLFVAGAVADNAQALRITVKCGSQEQVFEMPLANCDKLSDGEILRTFFGQLKIAQMIADGAEDAKLLAAGREFQLVTPNTSLIVLDNPGQYIQYRIRPPESLPEMRAEYDAHFAGKDTPPEDEAFTLKPNQSEQVKQLWNALVAWHKKDFPKTKPVAKSDLEPEPEDGTDVAQIRALPNSVDGEVLRAFAAPVAAAASYGAAAGDAFAEESSAMYARETSADDDGMPTHSSGAKTTLQAWNSQAPYLEVLAQAGDKAYEAYLKQRKDYETSPGFYMDCADALAKIGQRELAVRVLTNLAEIELENKALLRILGYKLRFLGELAQAETVFRRVVTMAQEEPQSYRDLALTLDDEEKFQEAVDTMMTIINFKFDSRFPEIEAIALTEINRIIARAERKGVKIQNVDDQYRRLIDTDIRIVLNWDADMMDIDLWTTDPFNVKCYYGYRLTPTGGRNSCDFTQGYGPEEFMIRDAIKGEYKIEANYFGSHSQKVLGPVTLYTEVYTNYGRPDEKREVLTCRLANNKEVVLIGHISHDGTIRKPHHDAPFDYQVKKGDTLESIAKEQLGDALRIDDILALNPQLSADEKLKVGSIIKLPPTK